MLFARGRPPTVTNTAATVSPLSNAASTTTTSVFSVVSRRWARFRKTGRVQTPG